MGELMTNDRVRLTYRDTGGEGVPLVMLHGWGQTQKMFRHQMDGLAPARRVITLDLRGHGLSEKPRHGYRIARLAHDVLDLVDHLGLDRFDALGWSMGASVWWSFIDQYGSGRIRRLVAVDQPAAVAAVPWLTPEEQRDSGAIFGVADLLELGAALAGPDGGRVRDDFVRGMFSGDPDGDLIAFVMEEIKSTPSFAGVPLLYDHCAQDWRDVLPRVDVPTLVIGCEGSHVSPASQRFIAGLIPDARLHVFPAGVANSHFPFLENPPAFNAVVDTFLSAADEISSLAIA
ncbi:alpha/beta fold hydrolase [Streptomyces sp. OR43]|uniref:alpha/beta fold hydrolase n=1 Tax=Streptomyces sp. or43 TaxID=2478957 RepID=UPI0011CE8C01|nr:alpha/beta hydrolase [Streptomyces sp. or43]TXS38830.1 alpha/beta hydrolase [Streptomyces sp. or43]